MRLQEEIGKGCSEQVTEEQEFKDEAVSHPAASVDGWSTVAEAGRDPLPSFSQKQEIKYLCEIVFPCQKNSYLASSC